MNKGDSKVVNDYSLINDISVLFKKKIVLYGAGDIGGRCFEFLHNVGIEIECFCDKRAGEGSYKGKDIIDIHALKKMTEGDEAAIVISSNDYVDSILQDLEKAGISIYDIYTYFGIKIGIELHLKDGYFSERIVKDFLEKKEMHNRYNQCLSESAVMCSVLTKGLDAIVYHMGKVGSTSVCHTLRHFGVNAYQLYSCYSQFLESYADDWNKWRSWAENAIQPLKIVSLVREPIIRDISDCFEEYGGDVIPHNLCGNTIEEDVIAHLDRLSKDNYQFAWFDDRMMKFTGVDVYKHNFDKERGWQIIRENNVEILLLQLERLNENQEVLGNFVGIADCKIVKANQANNKIYRYVYDEVKRTLRIPRSIINRYYEGNEKMDHFYSKEQQARFLEKLSPMIE